MKSVLITGGAGFIGTHLAIFLTRHGHNVTILDSLTEQIHGASKYLPPPGVILLRVMLEMRKWLEML